MNPNQFNRRARRAAKKMGKKIGRPPKPEEIKKMKVQTVPVWAQITLIFFGGAFIFFGAYAQLEHESTWTCLILSLIGLAFMLLGVFGKKKTVEDVASTVLDQSVDVAVEVILSPLKLLDF